MMTMVETLVDQLHRTFEGEAWHGDPVLTILRDVGAELAAARPLANAHSIWELVLHMAVWKDVARWRIEHSERVPTDAENFPPVTDTSEAAWQQAVARLIQAHRALVAAVTALREPQLTEEIPAGGGLSHAARLLGVIEHDVYHAGQIALLKKASR
jgi:uncharacterized damage-inducible protein DinB